MKESFFQPGTIYTSPKITSHAFYHSYSLKYHLIFFWYITETSKNLEWINKRFITIGEVPPNIEFFQWIFENFSHLQPYRISEN